MADAYATFAEFQLRWGADRTASLLQGSATERQDRIESALTAASARIDTAAFDGGYTVPLVPADLAPNSVDLQTRITAWLVEKTIVISHYLELQPVDTSEQVKRAQELCRDWLAELKAGSGLPVATPASDGLVDLIEQPGTSSRLTQQTFQEASFISI